LDRYGRDVDGAGNEEDEEERSSFTRGDFYPGGRSDKIDYPFDGDSIKEQCVAYLAPGVEVHGKPRSSLRQLTTFIFHLGIGAHSKLSNDSEE